MAGNQLVPWTAGSKITAAALLSEEPFHAVKPSPTTITNSTTLADDPDLQINIAGAGTYIIEGFLNTIGAAIGTGDLKMTIAYTGSTSFSVWGNLSMTTSSATALAASGNFFGATQSYGVNGGNYSIGALNGQFVATTGGTLKVQWAQNTANATTGTTMRQGSWLRVTQSA